MSASPSNNNPSNAINATANELLCGVCYELYTLQGRAVPILFACSHTLCVSCVNELKQVLLQKQPQLQGCVECHVCRQVVRVVEKPQQDQVNAAIVAVLQATQASQQKQQQSSTTCVNCEEHKASVFCQQCKMELCEECFAAAHVLKVRCDVAVWLFWLLRTALFMFSPPCVPCSRKAECTSLVS